jgi:hypothetical protein
MSIDFTKAYDSTKKISLYNVPIKFEIPIKEVKLIKNVFR